MGLNANALTTLGPLMGELGVTIPGVATIWAPGTTYGSNALVQPKTAPNGRAYKVTSGGGGSSGATEPVWPLVTGATVVDGALTWTDQGPSVQPRLERLINQASDAIERYCSRKLIYGQWTENLKGYGTNRLIVSRTPLISVVSVSFQGAAIDATEYEIEDQIGSEPSKTGFIYRQIGWTWTANYVLAAEPYRLPHSEYDLYQVVYLGGYQTPQFDGQAGQNSAAARARDLPFDLEQACIDIITSAWRRAGMDRTNQAETFGDAKIEFVQASADVRADVIPPDVREVLNRYKRMA